MDRSLVTDFAVTGRPGSNFTQAIGAFRATHPTGASLVSQRKAVYEPRTRLVSVSIDRNHRLWSPSLSDPLRLPATAKDLPPRHHRIL